MIILLKAHYYISAAPFSCVLLGRYYYYCPVKLIGKASKANTGEGFGDVRSVRDLKLTLTICDNLRLIVLQMDQAAFA